MKYENKCGSCLEFKDKRDCKSWYNNSDYELGYCELYKTYCYPDDHCSTYYKNRETYVASLCYITTIICDLLGYCDSCYELETLRNFRNNIMQKDEKYKHILFEYDLVGPVIAKNLLQQFENEDKEIVIGLYNFYIVPTVRFINENNYDEAILRYVEMTKTLEDYYGIDTESIVPDNYDYTSGGHGKIKLLKGE